MEDILLHSPRIGFLPNDSTFGSQMTIYRSGRTLFLVE